MTGHLNWSSSVLSTSFSSYSWLSNWTSEILELVGLIVVTLFVFSIITWSWEITFIPLWIVLCISLVGVLYTIIFAGILLRMPDVNADQRRFDLNNRAVLSALSCHVFSRSSTNSALGYSFLVVPLLVFLVLLTNKMDETVKISYFAAASPLFLTFFTLIITSFGSRGKSAALPCSPVIRRLSL